MVQTPDREVHPEEPAAAGDPPILTERWMAELGTLLHELETVTVAHEALPPVLSEVADNQLVQVRLGTAASLFAALQCKHAASAGHSLRVALSCSAWAASLGLGEPQRDAVEIAALLHDVGVIGAPDHILLKPGQLDGNEAAVMARARQMSLEILRHSCTSAEVLRIVEYVPARFDGSGKGLILIISGKIVD
jgi:response regulator RpfG family c-di-GMP phosphodiesterase